MCTLRLSKIGKRYDDSSDRPALETFDLEVQSGELVAVVGPSGCGKSTTLRIVAGLEEPTSGRVYIDDRDVTDLAPADRDIAMVFQSYALYPHMSVFENLAFALRIRKVADAEIRASVQRVAESLGIEEYLARKPKSLSGGQRQRVAIGRAIIRDPKVFLFDEPLSNLDAKLRAEMRREIARIRQRQSTTALYVTHDQVEAMTLADRIVVLRDGKVQQVGTPDEIYNQPATRFVAGFFGTPAMNFLTGEATGVKQDVVVGIRPEAVALSARPGATTLSAAVELREALGPEVLLHLSSNAGELTVRTTPANMSREGEQLTIWLETDKLHLFDAQTERRL